MPTINRSINQMPESVRGRRHYSFQFKLLIMMLLVMIVHHANSQNQELQEDTLNKKRLNTIVYTSTGLYAGTMTLLYFGWYQGTPMTSFHFFNDNENDLQLDKFAHATTAYVFTGYAYNWLRWAGLNNNKASIYSGLMGFASMSVIEILDGFSAEYGASWGDLVANAAGPTLFMGQQMIWKEQRMRLKFSYHPTDYAQYNPKLLGENHLQRALKDYNGMTFWLSANVHSFLREESRFPPWINIAVGYGGCGILGVTSNPSEIDGKPVPHFDRVRKYYLTLDIDWTKIKTNSSALRFVFKTLSFVKFPFPALEYNHQQDFVFHWIYF